MAREGRGWVARVERGKGRGGKRKEVLRGPIITVNLARWDLVLGISASVWSESESLGSLSFG